MKTKKTSKILSVVLTLAVLVCSLSAVSGFVTTAETNPEETELINSLKNAWQSLSINSSIANSPLTLPYMQNQKNPDNIIGTTDWCAKTFAFNVNGTFNKTPASTETYVRGLLFNVNTDTEELFSSSSSAFSNAFNNNDSLYFTFNPGTVKASGNLLVVLQYDGYGANYARYAEVPVNVGDTGDKKIEIEKLTYKCGSSSADSQVYTFTQLSDLLGQYQNASLLTIKIMFDKTVNIEGATISDLQGVKYAPLPAGNENFTALQWYKAAKDLDVSGYENAAAFTTALNNLKTYLSNNSQDFLASELKTAWQEMYEKNTVANIKTDKAINETTPVDLSNIGISFTDTSNSETGYTFNKTQHESTVGYSNYLIFNSLYWDQYAKAYKWFDKGVTDNSFNNAFSQNDDIIFTVNTGELKNAGKLRIILRYDSWNTINKEIEFNEPNKEIAISFKELFGLENLSDALFRPKTSDPLVIVRIAFSSELATNSAKLYPLKTVKYAPLPEENESFTPLQWYNEANDLDVRGYENAAAFTTALDNLETYLSNNSQDFMASELKKSWSKLSKDIDIAKLKTDVLVNQMSGDNTKTLAGVGLTFNENNKFNKSAYDPNYVGGTYYLYGLVFSKKNSTGDNVFFDSNLNSSDNNAFNSAFSDDSLYFTFNPGTVTTPGKMWVLLQYNDYGYENVLYSPVEIKTTDSNTPIRIDINKCTFHSAKNDAVIDHTHLSDLLKYTNPENKEVSLYTMKVFFDPYLVTEGSSISELKTVKKETVPSDTDNELILRKSLRVDTDFYEENVNDFVANKDRLYNYLMTDKTLGNVTEKDDIDIRDLVALKNLGYENDETYKLIADMNKDGYITKDDTTVLRRQILNS